MTDQNDDQHRVKILSFKPQLLIEVFNWHRNPVGWLGIPIVDGVPEDVEVVAVSTNWDRRVIDLMIRHQSFEVVPVNEEPPRIPDVMTEFRIREVT